MVAAIKQNQTITIDEIKHPINVAGKNFLENKAVITKWLRDEAPVYKGKLIVIGGYIISRYEDCAMVLKDPRFIRDRSVARGGGSKLPFPAPKSVKLMAESMILMDGDDHRRLRNLVHKAFTPRAIQQLGEQVESMSHELLDKAGQKGQVDLQKEYALPIPVTVIARMVGVPEDDMHLFSGGMKALTDGLSGLNIIRTFLLDMPRLTKYVRELIAKKRANPQDDILTALIQAEEEGDKLSEDELISMVFLLIVAGYETTVHLITNSVVTLLEHPEQFAMLKANRELMDTAIEEVMRYKGPVEGTKPHYSTEDVTLHGVTIPKGSMVMTLLGSANHDERQFENPEVFDITRNPNPHFGFGRGIHYCLGAPLARLETKIALNNLLDRYPNMRLAVKPEELQVQNIPSWHRYESLPIILE